MQCLSPLIKELELSIELRGEAKFSERDVYQLLKDSVHFLLMHRLEVVDGFLILQLCLQPLLCFVPFFLLNFGLLSFQFDAEAFHLS